MPIEPLSITLEIDDPDVLAWLLEFDEGDRPTKVATALRIGVLALRQAAGFIDRQAIRDEGAQLTTKIDRQVTEAMTAMVGPESKLMRTLDPKQADGLVAQLREAVDTELTENGKQIMGAFSLDDPRSPLSRLVAHVRESQKTLRTEFSLDDESSGLSRLLRKLNGTLDDHEKANLEFREQVQTTLSEMAVRKAAEARGTTHGIAFEDAVVEYVTSHASGAGDIASATGATTGLIKNCKIGDCVLELSPDHLSGGEKIVFEAKEDASYTIGSAKDEIEKGRRNRNAQIGVFVFSARSAPRGFETLRRYGRDIVVIWDAEDASTDVWLDAAIMLARGLVVEGKRASLPAADVDFNAIDVAIESVAKRAEKTDQVRIWGQTIESTGAKIVKEMEVSRKDLERQVGILRDRVDDARHALGAED